MKKKRDGHDVFAPAEQGNRPPGLGLGLVLRKADMAFIQILGAELAVYGVSVAQYQHLRSLWQRDGITQNELSRSVQVKDASSTSTLDGLEKKGLITRVRDPSDRRKMMVYLTKEARDLEQPLIACAQRTNAKAVEGLNSDEVGALFASIERVVSNLLTGAPPSAIASQD